MTHRKSEVLDAVRALEDAGDQWDIVADVASRSTDDNAGYQRMEAMARAAECHALALLMRLQLEGAADEFTGDDGVAD